jgi:hypothetical protein
MPALERRFSPPPRQDGAQALAAAIRKAKFKPHVSRIAPAVPRAMKIITRVVRVPGLPGLKL